MRELSLSAADTLEFIRRIIFAFLIGNGDAHGKNYSVLYHGRKVALAPMYDIMSTTIYPEVSARMAMKIDGEYAFKWITRGKFLRLAEKLGISPRTMDREISRMQKRIEKHAPEVAEKMSVRFPSSCYKLIVRGIFERSGQLAMFPRRVARLCAFEYADEGGNMSECIVNEGWQLCGFCCFAIFSGWRNDVGGFVC